MKEILFRFNKREKEILIKGLTSLCFYDLKGNMEDLEKIDKLRKELEEED